MDDAVQLWWIPLGAGGHVVRRCGRAYETLSALLGRRPRQDLYHAALELWVDGIRWVVEQAPVPDGDGWARGAVREAPVGARALGRLRMFRYEIRCWQDGSIPDVGEAVGTVRWNDAAAARRVLALVPEVPPLVWGRDEVGAGDMWTSNGIVAWLLASAGLDAAAVQPPAGGRAPGWSAGVAVARRRVVACG